MTIAVWPASLPSQPKFGTRVQFQRNVVEFEPSVGPAMTRRRATASVKSYEILLPLSEARGEPQTFIAFFEQTLADGSLPFTGLADPFGLAKTFRISGEPSLSETQNGYWEVSLTLEEVLS